MTDDNRLDRIEQKVDKLVDAMTTMARIEEKMAAHNVQVSAIERRIEAKSHQQDNIASDVQALVIENERIKRTIPDLEKRIRDLENTTAKNKLLVSQGERIFWLIITTGIGVISYFFKGDS